MLTRVYIDNYACFEKFEYRPASRQLILGRNGSGKSTLMAVLFRLREFAVGGDRADEVLTLKSRTRWRDVLSQVFEIEAALDGRIYVYRLGIGWSAGHSRVFVESLTRDGTLLFEFKDGEVQYRDDDGREVSYPFDNRRSAMATLGPDGKTHSLLRFRNWFAGMSFFLINPFAIRARTKNEDPVPNFSLSNMAAWYRHLVRNHPRENDALIADLRETLDDFHNLRLDSAGGHVQLLSVEFCHSGTHAKFGFEELSDGQRCLICLYAILHFVVARGGTVIIDEPENFISLREIQPWLMAADDMVDDHKGQVLLISHHPELINQWAPSYGVQFVRDGVGPVRVEPFRTNPEFTLSAAELVARGWEGE